jgi:hypothetical protein
MAPAIAPAHPIRKQFNKAASGFSRWLSAMPIARAESRKPNDIAMA